MKKIKSLILSGALLMVLTGCSQAAGVDVKINDRYTQTQLHTTAGKTVQAILDEAEIQMEQGDEITPALDTKIENDTEIEIQRRAKVQVTVDGQAQDVEMTGKQVQDALDYAKISIDENDYVNHQLTAYLRDGMTIEVEKRYQILVKMDGSTKKYLTGAGTVQEFLKEENIVLGKNDQVTPKQTKTLAEGTKIVVKRTEYKDKVVREEIPYETVTEYSDQMNNGTSKVTQQGVNGVKKLVYRITYEDGVEKGRKVIKETVEKKAVPEIITKGTKKTGKEIVSKQKIYDCDGSGHGYYEITYADGTVKYEDF